MKYLDEQIEVTFDTSDFTPQEYYTYTISTDNKIIFTGRIFVDYNNPTAVINISDIIKNYAFINKAYTYKGVRLVEDEYEGTPDENPIKKTFVVTLVNVSESIDVYLAYRYPHILKRLAYNDDYIGYCIQPGLTPMYPNVDSQKLLFGFTTLSDNTDPLLYNIEYNDGKTEGAIDVIYLAAGRNKNGLSFSGSLYDLKTYPLPAVIEDVIFVSATGAAAIPDDHTAVFENLKYEDRSLPLYVCVRDEEGTEVKLGEIHIDDYTTGGGTEHLSFTYDDPNGIIPRWLTIYSIGDPEQSIVDSSEMDPVYMEGHSKRIFSFDIERHSDEGLTLQNFQTLVWDRPTIKDGIYVNVDNTKIKIGDFCNNLTGYYLQWQDRLGSLQSQHFSGHPIFSIDYEYLPILNYRNEERNVSVEQTPKWTLNTGWINQELYPYYESIFVSPFLKLYDVDNDEIYDVIVTDKIFEEKTFHNQGRQLFNLKLNVKKSSTQNIIY